MNFADLFAGGLLVGVVMALLKKPTVSPGMCGDLRKAADERIARLEECVDDHAQLIGNVEPLLNLVRDQTATITAMARDISEIRVKVAVIESTLKK